MIRIAAILLFVPSLCAEIIPSYRRTTWTSAGVAGGIPNVTTIFATHSSGVSLATLNASIQSCPSNQVVKLNPGTFTFAGPIQFGQTKGVVLRGSGRSSTFLRFTTHGGGNNIHIGEETVPDRINPPAGNIENWTAGYSQGTTTITVADATDVPPIGHLLALDQLDNNVWIDADVQEGCSYCGRETGERTQVQYVRITGKSGNNITFEPGLHMWNYATGFDPEVWWWSEDDTIMCGVESMSITNESGSGTASIQFTQAQNCWVYDVDVYLTPTYAILAGQAVKNIEIRRVGMLSNQSVGSQSYGVVFYMASDSLMIDCIAANITGSMNYGPQSMGNVVIYNFFTNNVYSNPNWDIAALASHDAHVCMNLAEGNWANKMYYDSIHGSASHNTDHRNYYHGHQESRTLNTMAYDAQQYCLSNNIIGNILGEIGYHTQYQATNTAQFTDGDEEVYILGNNVASGSPAFDDRVAPSTLRHGNWDAFNQAIVWDAGISDHDIPASYYFASKPSFFGALEWPPFDSADPSDNYATNIPAGHRYLLGTDPPEESSSPLYFTNAVMRGKTLLRGKVVIR